MTNILWLKVTKDRWALAHWIEAQRGKPRAAGWDAKRTRRVLWKAWNVSQKWLKGTLWHENVLCLNA